MSVPYWMNFLESNTDKRKNLKRPGRLGHLGKKTSLPINRWLEMVFEWNEFRSIERLLNPEVLPLTDAQILLNFEKEFASKHKVKRGDAKVAPGNAVFSGKHGIGFQRNRCRRGNLYSDQERPFLLSFKYHTDGNIVSDKSKVRPVYLTFRECQQLCIDFKVCDPRFFSLEDMEKLHLMTMNMGTNSEWVFPTKEDLAHIYKAIPIDLYRSVMTYDLHKKETVQKKTSYSPIKQLEKTIKRDEEKEKDELEKRRRETKKFLETIDPSLQPEVKPQKKKFDKFNEDHGYGGISKTNTKGYQGSPPSKKEGGGSGNWWDKPLLQPDKDSQ